MLAPAGVRLECRTLSKQWGGPKPCTLDAGHRGYHSISTYECDRCGRRQRLPYASQAYDRFNDEVVAVFCFGCTKEDQRQYPSPY